MVAVEFDAVLFGDDGMNIIIDDSVNHIKLWSQLSDLGYRVKYVRRGTGYLIHADSERPMTQEQINTWLGVRDDEAAKH